MTHRLLWQNNKRSASWVGGKRLLEHNSLASCPREALFPGTSLASLPGSCSCSSEHLSWDLTSRKMMAQDHIWHGQFLRLCSNAGKWTRVWEILRLKAAYSVMSLSSPSVLLVNLERVHGTWRVGGGGWGRSWEGRPSFCDNTRRLFLWLCGWKIFFTLAQSQHRSVACFWSFWCGQSLGICWGLDSGFS